jgi:outer membrane lipoprotein-sorting protein
MTRLLALALLLAAPAWAGTARKAPAYTANQVFDRMLAAQEAQAYYRAEIEKAEGPVGQEPVSVTRGTLHTRPGARARLEIREPSPGLVLCDGKALWVELAEVQQVMKYDATRMIASGNFFLDLASSVRHYSHAAFKRLIVPGPGFDGAQVTALELLPKAAKGAAFERMQVWVDHERWTVLRVLLDLEGSRHDVRFSQIRISDAAAVKKDPELGPAKGLFSYKAPKGYEVFDLDL